MKPSFYSGAAGLLAYQQKMNTIGNNLANVNTVGYKNQVVGFDDLLYNQMYVNAPSSPLTGHGVKAVDGGLKFTQGSLRQTHYELDFAIAGDGLFAIEKDGQQMYTRDGEFALLLDGDNAYLGTLDGGYVLDQSGQPIQLERIAGSERFDTSTLADQIGLYSVANPGGLTPVNGNRYLATPLSGPAGLVTDESSKLLPGYIENSGAVLADEMTDMITAQRGYQVSARVVQVSDENEQTINNLRK